MAAESYFRALDMLAFLIIARSLVARGIKQMVCHLVKKIGSGVGLLASPVTRKAFVRNVDSCST
jgi:hypothetical protein